MKNGENGRSDNGKEKKKKENVVNDVKLISRNLLLNGVKEEKRKIKIQSFFLLEQSLIALKASNNKIWLYEFEIHPFTLLQIFLFFFLISD